MDASYDIVGHYEQDAINGLGSERIDRMLEAADLGGARSVLDAMAGNGNLSRRLAGFCAERGLAVPWIVVLEYSRIQLEFARACLGRTGTRIVWGDALGMRERESGVPLPDASFDRVLIKSATHEIPAARQPELYESVYRVLRPGGLFVNLGFAFDDPRERDEVRELARVKDSLAGMADAARNRHFLLREEFYRYLAGAGFVDVRAVERFDYTIRSQVVAEQYFPEPLRLERDLQNQSAQVKAITLRRNGRVRFEGTGSILSFPGEITMARRPSLAQSNRRLETRHPLDLLRWIQAHHDLLKRAASQVPPSASVLDLGCGIGLFTEHLPGDGRRYAGLDASAESIGIARERYGARPGISFHLADPAQSGPGPTDPDVVVVLGLLYEPGTDPVGLLRRAIGALRPGSRLIVSGPTSREGLSRAEPRVLEQLERDGVLANHGPLVQAWCAEERRRSASARATWSLEGMETLLRHLGCRKTLVADGDLFHGAAYLVAAEK